MKENKKVLIIIALIICIIFAGYLDKLFSVKESYLSIDYCNFSFDSFSYDDPTGVNGPDGVFEPIKPWKVVSQLPGEQTAYFQKYWVSVFRILDEQMELWIRTEVKPDENSAEWRNDYLIYLPAQEEWRAVSAEIGTTGVFAKKLFVSSTGTIWGINDNYPWDISVNNYPILSKFNDQTQSFEFVMASPDYRVPESRRMNLGVLNENDVFWIILQEDGLYGFDLDSAKTMKLLSIPNQISSVAIGGENSIYFQKNTGIPYLYKEEIWQYFTETDELFSVGIASERWPWGRMFVDRTGNLWFGSVGWRDLQDEWHLMHPEPEMFIENIGNDPWRVSAFLLMESSDGTLWFSKEPILGLGGMAWYNPQIEAGCWFTTTPGSIIEDHNQVLWLVIGSSLYKLEINP